MSPLKYWPLLFLTEDVQDKTNGEISKSSSDEKLEVFHHSAQAHVKNTCLYRVRVRMTELCQGAYELKSRISRASLNTAKLLSKTEKDGKYKADLQSKQKDYGGNCKKVEYHDPGSKKDPD
jgi:hypothetical protein